MKPLTRFLNRFRIQNKYLIVVLPFVVISYLLIGYSVFCISFDYTKELITQQTQQYIEERADYFNDYLTSLNTATDKIFYNDTIQDCLLTQQAHLTDDQYITLKNTMQQACYNYLAPGDMDGTLFLNGIRNIYIRNTYDETIITDAVYNDTLDRINVLTISYQEAAQNRHGKAYLVCQGNDRLYFIRAIYKNNIVDADDYIGLVIIDLDLRFISTEIIQNEYSEDIAFALLDPAKTVVVNASPLSDEDCSVLFDKQAAVINDTHFQGVSHRTNYCGYQILGVVNESDLYHNHYNILLVTIALILTSVLLIIIAILFASTIISKQFKRFIYKLNTTNSLGHHALLRAHTKDEFQERRI